MKKFNIAVPKKFVKNGETKTMWNYVGTLITWPPDARSPDGGFSIELNMFPDTAFKVFPQKERDGVATQTSAAVEKKQLTDEESYNQIPPNDDQNF